MPGAGRVVRVSIYITWGFSVQLPLPRSQLGLHMPRPGPPERQTCQAGGPHCPLEFGVHLPRGRPDTRGRASEAGSLGPVALGKRSEPTNDKTSLEVGVRTE